MVTSAPGRTVWLWGCERIAGEFSELENWNVPFVPVLSLAVMAIVVNPGEKTRNRSAPPLTTYTLSAASKSRPRVIEPKPAMLVVSVETSGTPLVRRARRKLPARTDAATKARSEEHTSEL